MASTNPIPSLSAFQQELVKMFPFDLSPQQQNEVKEYLSRYFAAQMQTEVDRVATERGYDADFYQRLADGEA